MWCSLSGRTYEKLFDGGCSKKDLIMKWVSPPFLKIRAVQARKIIQIGEKSCIVPLKAVTEVETLKAMNELEVDDQMEDMNVL